MIKDKKLPQIWKDCELRVTYSLLHDFFQIFEAENCPNKDIIHTLHLVSKKSEDYLTDIVRQPAKFFLTRSKDLLIKIQITLRKSTQLSPSYIWKNRTALWEIRTKN